MTKEEFKAYLESIGNANACTWCRKYQKVTIGGKALLCHRPKDAEEEDSNEASNKLVIDLLIRACKINDWFKATHKTHAEDHLIGRALQNLINKKCSSSMPG